MLYVSTRDRTGSYTAYRALHDNRAPDGGMFVPMRMPMLSQNEMDDLLKKSFGTCVAHVLNLFFSLELSGWDVDFLVGRQPFRLTVMSHRLIIGELWRNQESRYQFLERSLYERISGVIGKPATEWAKIAIRIAVLFGLSAEVRRLGIESVDVAACSGDFSLPVALWYAKSMGLPLDKIICGSSDESTVWDMIHRGEFHTGTASGDTGNTYPHAIERLIYGTLGLKETQRYVDACTRRGMYSLQEEQAELLRAGLFAAVVSKKRADSVIKSTYHTNQYLIDFETAAAYAGLQDYRSRTGESRSTLLIADNSPIHADAVISGILGITREELRKQL